jgi:hypothetical protein
MNMNKPEKTRRSFLKGAAVTTAAVGTGVASRGVLAGDETTPEKAARKGYRETDHVRAYYRLARI